MKEDILIHQNNPAALEKMYRENKAQFKKEFNTIHTKLSGTTLADFWNARLNYESKAMHPGTRADWTFIIIASLLAGVIAKFPALFAIDEEFFYPRNIGFIVFPVLTAYFAWKNKLTVGKIIFISGVILAGLIFINLLPNVRDSDVLTLACIHLLLVQWFVLGYAFVGGAKNGLEKRLGFLKYNGDLVVISALILISGGILTGITIGLFSLIGLNIERFWFDYIVIFGLAAVPIVGTYLTRTNPQLVGKVSPVIARIFSPLVLLMLVVYLGAMIYSGKDPYNDREFLMIFNALLIGVMALIFFSVAEASKETKSKPEIWVLFLLSVVTVIVNGIAISAIIYRIAEWGITPNRAAVLGANVLILVNLFMVTAQLFRVISKRTETHGVGKAIALYLPVYFIWAAIVTFLFPLIFGID